MSKLLIGTGSGLTTVRFDNDRSAITFAELAAKRFAEGNPVWVVAGGVVSPDGGTSGASLHRIPPTEVLLFELDDAPAEDLVYRLTEIDSIDLRT